MAYTRKARFPALPRFRGALYFLRSEEQRSEQAKPKSEAGGKARRSFILPPSPYSYNNTLRSCYNGGSLRSCSQPASAASVRPPARQLACQPPRQLPLRAPYLSSILLPTAAAPPPPPPPTRGPCHCHIQLSLLFPPECQSQKSEVKTPCWPSRTWSKRWACLKTI